MKNKYQIKDDITEIYVESPKYGLKTILIDSEDFNLVSGYNWCVNKQTNRFYCKSTKKPYIRLHRLIIVSPKRKIIDHKNHNGLDNKKCNLRVCINKENIRNSKKYKNNNSGLKGVSLYIMKKKNKEYKYWRSQIMYNNKQIHLGYFPHTEMGRIQAAIAYDLAATKLFGEFALLNFPEKETQEI